MRHLCDDGNFSVEAHMVWHDGHTCKHRASTSRYDTLGEALDCMDRMSDDLRTWYYIDRPDSKYYDILVFDESAGELVSVRTSERL